MPIFLFLSFWDQKRLHFPLNRRRQDNDWVQFGVGFEEYQMEATPASNPPIETDGTGNPIANTTETEGFGYHVDEIIVKVDQLEQRVNDVEQFYVNFNKRQASLSKGSSIVKDKDRERPITSMKKQHQEALHREAAAAKRMQDLIRQFGTIFRQITQHKWAWPFLKPVDVKALKLDDYYKIIDKPMDFSTIKNQMEAKDGTGYKNVREIYADMTLVFNNAMKYNPEKSDVHVMAKKLLEKFEEKWQLLLPKVIDEEKRREDEEAEAELNMQLAKEVSYAKIARDITNEIYEVDMHLEELRETVVQKCRKVSSEDKRRIGNALGLLSPEDLSKALEIVAQNNPNFQATAEEVELDMDAQSESTLWRLKFFVKDALEMQDNNKASTASGGTNNNNGVKKTTTKKRSRKPSTAA